VHTRLMTASVAIGATLLAVATPGAATEPAQPAVEVLVRGAPLPGADGMVFDTHDRLWVTSVPGREDFAVPLNAIRFQDDLVVAELATGLVVRLDAGTGERTTLAQGLFVPAGLAASDDDLWVGDWASGVVWQIVADGQVLASPVPVAGGLVQPEGLALDRDGSLLVVESGLGRVTRVDPATGAISPVASGLGLGAPAVPGTPPTWVFNGVAVGATGDIYVSGDVANVVYRLTAENR